MSSVEDTAVYVPHGYGFRRVTDEHRTSTSDSATVAAPGTTSSRDGDRATTSSDSLPEDENLEGSRGGRAFGDFRVLGKLGGGAHSEVFHVVHTSTGIEMALKCYFRLQPKP
jgi:hypothetical protein